MSPGVSLPAAVAAVGIDSGIAWHYGDPMREQRILETAAGVIDRSNRPVLAISGPDRLPWLHSICSQHVSNLADGESTEALVLSPHGHVEQHWQLTERDDTVWLDVEPGMADDALGYLEKMRFLKRVEPSEVSDEWAVIGLVGPAADAVLVAAGHTPPTTRAIAALPAGGFARRTPWGDVDLVVLRARLADEITGLVAAGAAPAGLWAYDAKRVEARRPRLRFETDHRTIPHEVGWIDTAVHLDKGCYRGQETVARVQNLGRPPRRLVLVHLAGESDVLPDVGTSVELAGRSVGFLGTAVQHHELGPVALAVIKRSIPDDAELTVAGSSAAIA
jgi:tRNA-modifying protein YgfZ